MSCLIAVSLLLGCGIYSKKSQREQKSENSYKQYEEQRLLFHQKHMDSLSTYWYFWTDSLLSFRPDSGLSAHGGRMYVQQSRSTLAEGILDARQKNALEQGSLDSVTMPDKRAFSFDSLFVVISILSALLYLIWRARHTMR
ncbi:hypothetical protein HX021_13430 [Sphingobacterium sp. N143]|uniref:hypothetical protein n=1 Tax=Sphingobacterium sp. N143 TaxID=2746727 RepID=UPI0025751FD8|nr:hypothetical protein [Sphingobacterium sp. N143]MDM1295284.1 hypothetical protein [Sphingobacterium sp. N143]